MKNVMYGLISLLIIAILGVGGYQFYDMKHQEYLKRQATVQVTEDLVRAEDNALNSEPQGHYQLVCKNVTIVQQNGGFATITGVVKNVGNLQSPSRLWVVDVTLYGSDNTILGTGNTLLQGSVAPGEQRAFSVFTSSAGQAIRATASIH